MPGDLDQALECGEIEVIPTWMDMTLYHRDAGFGVRAISLDIPVYTTGLVAADRLPSAVVSGMRDAFVAGYDLQRAAGADALLLFDEAVAQTSGDVAERVLSHLRSGCKSSVRRASPAKGDVHFGRALSAEIRRRRSAISRSALCNSLA